IGPAEPSRFDSADTVTLFQFGGKNYQIIEERAEEHLKLRDYFYGIVYDLLKSEALSSLKLCPICDRIFVCASLKADFCNDECRWKFNNQKRLKDGTFKKYRANR